MPYHRNTGFPALTPSYGLGSYGRTNSALLISSPRTKNGSQGRIYAWMKNQMFGSRVQAKLSQRILT